MAMATFEWDPAKDLENQRKHKVSLSEAQYAFADSSRVIRVFGAGFWRKRKSIYDRENQVHQ